MMYVLFTNAVDGRIKIFEKIKFEDAVKLTHEIEKNSREENKVFFGEFHVVDDNDTLFYKGIFNFGSYDYPNIYHQIHEMVNRIKVDKKNQADKMYLLEQIEKLTPEEYKKKENIDRTLINLDKKKISKLKKWQRRTIYFLTTTSMVALSVSVTIFFVSKFQYEEAIKTGREVVAKQDVLIESYETALIENGESLIPFLEKQSDLSESQKRILVSYYLEKDEFNKAVELFDDPVHVETLILTSNMIDKTKVEKIKIFNELYPTNEARFDLAYFARDYQLMLNIPSINTTIERSKMKTYGLLKLGKIEEAKVELNNNNDEQLKQKITSYEVLKAEITTLDEKHKRLTADKKTDEAKKVQAESNKKKNELKAL
ncbi:MAG: hypothetical protein ACI35O_16510 [Bacillaceae bacterium]